jgi:hypothetical protein
MHDAWWAQMVRVLDGREKQPWCLPVPRRDGCPHRSLTILRRALPLADIFSHLQPNHYWSVSMSGESLLSEARSFFSELPPEPTHFAVRLLFQGVEVQVRTDETELPSNPLAASSLSRVEAGRFVREQKLRTSLRSQPRLLKVSKSALIASCC